LRHVHRIYKTCLANQIISASHFLVSSLVSRLLLSKILPVVYQSLNPLRCAVGDEVSGLDRAWLEWERIFHGDEHLAPCGQIATDAPSDRGSLLVSATKHALGQDIAYEISVP
jgi:hypothetical protein